MREERDQQENGKQQRELPVRELGDDAAAVVARGGRCFVVMMPVLTTVRASVTMMIYARMILVQPRVRGRIGGEPEQHRQDQQAQPGRDFAQQSRTTGGYAEKRHETGIWRRA